MKRKHEEQIGDIIRQFMRDEGIETPYNEFRLIQAWPEVVGPAVERCTGKLFIKNSVLYVQLNSSVIRHELFIGRKQLAQRLNNHIGAQVITNIVFC